MEKPSKKAVSDLINKVAGQPIMTEKKLEKIMVGAKKKFDSNGMTGFLEYLRDVTQAPVSTDWMKGIVDQIKTSDGMKKVIDQYQIPMHLKGRKKGSKPLVSLKAGRVLRLRRKKVK